METRRAKKILIVDDEPNIVLALKYLLEDEGYEINECYDGQSGFQTTLDWKPDLVLLDVMMPGLDGYSVARKIREKLELQDIQIIFLTAKGTARDKMEGYDSGAELYIVKPFDNEHIIEKVGEVLGTELNNR